MRVTRNECVQCGLPCMGNACPNAQVERLYCDVCNSEETLYYFNDQELCIDCIEGLLEEVE